MPRKPLLLVLFLTFLLCRPALPAPGDPFGGDDAGCVPTTAPVGKCEDGVAKALTKYVQALLKCHINAADQGVKGKAFDEELCESDPTTGKGAKEKYDVAIAKLAPTCGGQCAITNAPGLRAAIEMVLEANNGLIYACSGTAFGGDDSGNVPPDSATGKCENGVAKALTKYVQALLKCHIKAADQGVKGKAFDEELCESDPSTGKGAKEKYDAAIAKLALTCPMCSTANASAVRSLAETAVECHNGDVYCDGTVPSACAANCPTTTTTSTSTSTTTSTSSSTSSTSSSTTTSTSTSSTTSTSTSTSTTTSSTTSTTICVATSGSFCDLGNGTIYDSATGLQWEKKTTTVGSGVNATDLHDVDNPYQWAGTCSVATSKLCQPNLAAETACKAQTPAAFWVNGCEQCVGGEGTCTVAAPAITTVWDWVTQVNAANYAGQTDWRLPSEDGRNAGPSTELELESILPGPYPTCGTSPCIASIFGPTLSNGYWSSTTRDVSLADTIGIDFTNGFINPGYTKSFTFWVRAVRGGS
jgi:hypothetical protein